MVQILTATSVMAAIALACGVVLAVAYARLRVWEDPRLEQVEALLPGNNCGACGQPGCHAFAETLLANTSKPGQCTVNSAAGTEAVADFLGVDAGAVEKQVARLHCAGGAGDVRRLAAYTGSESCRAAVLVNGGGRACRWGCLGLADCERACTFDAIAMTRDGLPKVVVDKCTACGDCVDVCPLDLFELQPLSQPLLVQCRTPLSGDAARDVCAVACDACGRCALDAPKGAVEMVDGLPVIKEPDVATAAATFRCPTGAIQWVTGTQFDGLVQLPSTRRDRA